MNPAPRIAQRLLNEERGFTFPELMVAMVIALITAGTAMVVLQMAMHTEPQIRERSGQIQQGRFLIEQLTRELRQGESVSSATASSLQIITYANSATCGGAAASTAIPCRVTYSCSASACTRTERNPDGSGSAPAQTVVDGIQGPNVFTYSPSTAHPSYVTLTLAFPGPDGQESVTLSDGVALRNFFGEAS